MPPAPLVRDQRHAASSKFGGQINTPERCSDRPYATINDRDYFHAPQIRGASKGLYHVLIKHAAELELCDTVDTLWQGAVRVLSSIGIDHAIYLSVDTKFDELFIRSTMPDLYIDTPPNEDPFLIHACNRYEITPIGAEFVADHPYVSDADTAFIQRAAKQGFRAGLGLPMRLKGSERFGGFLLGNALDHDTFLKRMMPRSEEIRLFCMIIHRRIEELRASESPASHPSERRALIPNTLPECFDTLTPRELEVVAMLAQGQTRKATAHTCDISVHTVSDYAKSAYKKLDVRNRAEAATLLYGQTLVKSTGP